MSLPRAVAPATSPTTPASAAATATTAIPPCSARRSAPATSATWTACSTPTPSCSPPCTDYFRATVPKEPGDSDFVYRQAIRAKAFDAAAGHPAGGVAVQRRHLRHRPGATRSCCCACGPTRCPRPAPTPTSCCTSCARSSRSFLRRVDLADRGGRLERLPGDHPRRPWPTWSSRLFGDEHAGRAGAGGARWSTSTPTPRTSWWPRICYPYSDLPETQIDATGCARSATDERVALAAGLRRRADEPPAQARAGPSSASTTASTCSPTTAPSATCSATAC